jgi:hypothetical protein
MEDIQEAMAADMVDIQVDMVDIQADLAADSVDQLLMLKLHHKASMLAVHSEVSEDQHQTQPLEVNHLVSDAKK